MMESAFILAHTAGCALACWYALTGLNACTRKTALAARLSFAAIAIGAFAALLSPPDLDAAGLSATLIAAGVGMGFVANRRTCVCLNCPMRPGARKPAPMEWTELHPERRATDRANPRQGTHA